MRDCHCRLCVGDDDSEIERRGWRVVAGDGYAFTVGLWHSFGSAEAAIFGLVEDDMVRWLSAVGGAVEGGRMLYPDRQGDGILGSFDVFPRPALASWHRHLFADALRFYRGQPVPVLQLVWADGRGLLPWEPGCEDSCRLAQPPLWDRAEPRPLPSGWAFPVSPDALVLTTKPIAFGAAAIAGVVHDEEGEWQFLDSPSVDMEDLTIVHLAHVVDGRGPELAAVADLPSGWESWRDAAGGWTRQPLDGDDEDW